MHFLLSTHFSTVNSKDTLLVAGNALMDQFSSTPIPTLYENKQNLLFLSVLAGMIVLLIS